MCIITVYRSPNDNFQYFIKGLDNIIKKMYKPDVQLIIGADININCLSESKEKQELNNILNSYNLVGVINFPTRVKNNSRSAIDNTGWRMKCHTFLLLQKHLTSGTELILIGWKIVPNEEHVQCDHRFASQPLANEPLHSSQLFDTSLQKARGITSLCGP